MGEVPPDRDRDGPALFFGRLGLLVLALALVWLALEFLNRYRMQYAATFRFSTGPVILVALAAFGGGCAIGLASSLPVRIRRYTAGRAAVLGVLPLLLTAAFVIIFSGRFDWLPGSIVLRLGPYAEAGLIISALLLGIGVAAGFGRPPRVSTPPAPTVQP
jgi:hypothetical protein